MQFENELPKFKSKYKNELIEFIKFKRANGYKFHSNTIYRLIQFDNYLSLTKDKTINQDTIDGWLKLAEGKKVSTINNYHQIYSSFIKFLKIKGYDLPYIEKPHYVKSEFVPYIFSKEEINKMFSTIKIWIESSNELKYKTFYLMLSLYYGCGLRLNEVINLKREEFDVNNKRIIIKDGKNNVSRYIPLSKSIYEQILTYIEKTTNKINSEYLFVRLTGDPISKTSIYQTYHKLLNESEIQRTFDGSYQRIHDLRHTFAVHSLKQMEAKGFDLYTSLPLLSTYLGHKHLTETEYYLRMVQEEAVKSVKKVKLYTENIYEEKEEFYEE